MGQRGPQKTPTAILERRGSSLLPNRHDDPKPTMGDPGVPEWLSDEAKEAWTQHSAELVRWGLLTVVDGFAYSLLCQTYADYVDAVAVVREHDQIATSEKGAVYQHPAVGIMNKASERLMKACREFGLTPSARSGMNVAPPETEAGGVEVKFKIHAG